MAKKAYNIPLQKIQQFIKTHKTELQKLTTEKKFLEYNKTLGKSYYLLEIEKFLHFFKINIDLPYALSTIEHFNSITFVEQVFHTLNLSHFELKSTTHKDFFYALLYILAQKENELFELFLEKLFLHYHSAFNKSTNTNIDYKEMSQTIIKTRKIVLKESFGEEEGISYFKLFLDEKPIIIKKGKLIKSLRKKAYKNLFYYLID